MDDGINPWIDTGQLEWVNWMGLDYQCPIIDGWNFRVKINDEIERWNWTMKCNDERKDDDAYGLNLRMWRAWPGNRVSLISFENCLLEAKQLFKWARPIEFKWIGSQNGRWREAAKQSRSIRSPTRNVSFSTFTTMKIRLSFHIHRHVVSSHFWALLFIESWQWMWTVTSLVVIEQSFDFSAADAWLQIEFSRHLI